MKFSYTLLLGMVLMASCSTKNRSAAYLGVAGSVRQESVQADQLGRATNESASLLDADLSEEKIKRVVIYDANVTLEVKVPDSTNNALEKIATKFDGYVVSLGSQRSQIRVRTKDLQTAVAEIALLGKLKNKSIYGADVTDSYIDNEIRLENAIKARERYLELLAKAENVEAALKVEIELERLNGLIDLYEGTLRKLSHLSEYSTITVTLQEKVKPGILGYIGIGIYEGIRWLFVRK
jgi:cell division protein ZapA (FtsZ GTPase activity inhibitor)